MAHDLDCRLLDMRARDSLDSRVFEDIEEMHAGAETGQHIGRYVDEAVHDAMDDRRGHTVVAGDDVGAGGGSDIDLDHCHFVRHTVCYSARPNSHDHT